MDNNKVTLIGLALIGGAVALSNTVSDIQSRIIIGETEMVKHKFQLSGIELDFEMPVKNASDHNLSFDGFVGHLTFKGHSIADITILQTIQLTAGQVVKIPIVTKIWYTTVVAEVAALWNELKTIIQTRKFNGEMYVNGVAYSGGLSFNINERVF